MTYLCGKAFGRLVNLKRHKLRHTEKCHGCGQCKQAFARPGEQKLTFNLPLEQVLLKNKGTIPFLILTLNVNPQAQELSDIM